MVKFALLAKIFLPFIFAADWRYSRSSQTQARNPVAASAWLYHEVPSTSLRFAQDDKMATLFCQFFGYLGEGVDGKIQVLSRMRSGDLRAHARGAMWNDGIKETDNVNAFLQHPCSELL
jgi:hypothetical protein